MPNHSVLLTGLSAELTAELACRVAGASVLVAGNGREALHELEAAGVSLLVLDHNTSGPSALDVLVQVRATARLSSLPVLYCLSPGPAAVLLRKLVEDLGVDEILFQPVDCEELARRVRGILGLPPRAPLDSPDRAALRSAVGVIWEKARASKLESLEVLDQAGVALLEGSLTAASRQAAEREAHKLAGSLASFGFPAASRFAQEMESTLHAGTRVSEVQALRFLDLVIALRLELEQASHPASAAPAALGCPGGHQSAVLVVDPDPHFAARLTEEGSRRGLRVEAVLGPAAARTYVAGERPEIVLLALDASSEAPEDETG